MEHQQLFQVVPIESFLIQNCPFFWVTDIIMLQEIIDVLLGSVQTNLGLFGYSSEGGTKGVWHLEKLQESIHNLLFLLIGNSIPMVKEPSMLVLFWITKNSRHPFRFPCLMRIIFDYKRDKTDRNWVSYELSKSPGGFSPPPTIALKVLTMASSGNDF